MIYYKKKKKNQKKNHISNKKLLRKKLEQKILKKPFLFYDKKDLSHDPLIRLAKENPTYSNVIVNQFIQGLISGKAELKEFNKIKDYLRLNETSQPVKVINKLQLLKPHRYKKNPNPIHFK